MPVWRKPTVVSALTTVSPESSSTNRSTPCVLGCCGPMLTVIVSWRISFTASTVGLHLPVASCQFFSGNRKLETTLLSPSFDQRANRVNHRAMHFLDPCRRDVRHVDVNRGRLANHTAVASRQRNRFHSAGVSCLEAGEHVRRSSTRRNPKRHVVGFAKRLDLPCKHPVERKVVVHAGDDAAVRRQRNRSQSVPLQLEPADQFRRHMLCVGGAAAVAEHQELAPRIERRADCCRRLDQRLLNCIARPAVQGNRLVEHRLNDCGIAHCGACIHQSLRARSLVASIFATNCSCETCSGSYVFTGCLI